MALNRTSAARLAAAHVQVVGPTPRADVTKILADRCGSPVLAADAVRWAVQTGTLAARGQQLHAPERTTPSTTGNANGHANGKATPTRAPLVASSRPAWTPTRKTDPASDTPAPSRPKASTRRPSDGWTELQLALLEQREQQPNASERDRIRTIADRLGLTEADVTRNIGRATTRLPPPPPTTSPPRRT